MKKHNKIIPLRIRCDCGRRVVNHHLYCDNCWKKKHSKEQRERERLERKKTGNSVIINPVCKRNIKLKFSASQNHSNQSN